MTESEAKNYIIEYGIKVLGYGPGWKVRVMQMSKEQAFAICKDFQTRYPKHGPIKKSQTYKRNWRDGQITIWDIMKGDKQNEC